MELGFDDFKEATEALVEELEGGEKVANTMEVTNLTYTVYKPRLKDLKPHLPWAKVEFEDRISMEARNPGNAWKELPQVWEPMMEEVEVGNGLNIKRFSYTYSERLTYQLREIVEELKGNRNSREALISIWNPSLDPQRLSRRRVPCTIGYQFFIRDLFSHGPLLHMTYLQRSCNFHKHYQDDVYLAFRLQEWMAKQVGVEVGTFSHWIGSFHIFV